MSSEHQAVFLRNVNPNITYVGDWTPVQANVVNNFGNFGPAYSPTLRSTNSSTGSSFSLSFQGSSITAFGSINIIEFSSPSNPSWQCFLDDISLGKPNIFPSPENNWLLCTSGNVPDGAHELVVNVTSDGMPFYLDYIEYRSSPDVSLENTLGMIDSSIDYISGWGSLGEAANQTSDPNGMANVTFIGVQLSWYGFIPTEEPHNASSGEYSIDGGPFASFQLAGLPQTATSTVYNQLFFITPTLDMGTHVVSVKYTGKPGQTPLTVDYLIAMNGSFPPSSTSSTSSAGMTIETGAPTTSSTIPSRSSESNNKSSSNVRALVGGVVGSIVGVSILIFLVWFKFYRQRNRESPPEIMPFLHQLTTIPLLQTNQTPKNPTQQAAVIRATEHHNLDSLNPISLYASTTPAFPSSQDTSTAGASVLSSNPRQRALLVTPAYGVSVDPRVLRQLEDSGLRLVRPPAVEELENPPTYTE